MKLNKDAHPAARSPEWLAGYAVGRFSQVTALELRDEYTQLASAVTTARSQVDAALADHDALTVQLQACQAALGVVMAEHTATVDELAHAQDKIDQLMLLVTVEPTNAQP